MIKSSVDTLHPAASAKSIVIDVSIAGELDEAGTEAAIADGWNAITDEAGKDKQLAAYVASLGVQR